MYICMCIYIYIYIYNRVMYYLIVISCRLATKLNAI